MGPDTEQHIKAQVSAAMEAVDLVKKELEDVKAKVKKVADRIDRHVTAVQRAEAAKRSTYDANMKSED